MLKSKIKNIHGGTLDVLGLAIICGDYPPGSKLPPEQKLCDELGVSRTILREVVKSLVAKGLISTGPKIGTLVLPREHWNWFDAQVVGWQSSIGFDPKVLDDLQELRAIIEPEAVRLAAVRATDEEIEALATAYRGMENAVMRNSDDDYITHDYDFHLGLLRASHNSMFLQMGIALGAMLREAFLITTRTPDKGISRSLPYHLKIVEMIQARDADGAYASSRHQIFLAQRDVHDVLIGLQNSPPSDTKRLKRTR
ncbi:Pyruvate dehydrogenase complex repressor [Betaproteobacteria bacterium MOLA814]|nr:Pyruvate dehydrogenase complex repressor [Betaproteobacteria bacterium MOLA814]